MKIENTKFPEVIVFTPPVYGDNRGTVSESFRADIFEKHVGYIPTFVQDNEAFSKKDVIRGLHFQFPNPQGKLIRAVYGAIFDVVVDVRKNSPTFGEWFGIELTSENKKQLWIPAGFAHGFLSLSDLSICQYKLTDIYKSTGQFSLRWDDTDVGIEWPLSGTPILSDKDINNTIGLQEINFL
jgi:dTDP-4-dehydrorhamnose 3,5-epimerase